MTIAFITSALPARFIRAQSDILGISRIICASNELEEVMRYAVPPGSSVQIVSVPSVGGLIAGLLFLIQEVRKAKKIIIFHECCWVALDVAILIIRPKIDFFPQVSMSSFSRVKRNRLLSMLWLFKNFGVIQGLLLIVWWNYFDFYDTAKDGGCGREVIAVLKHNLLNDVQLHNYEEMTNFIPNVVYSPSHESQIALIVCAREPVPDLLQLNLYQKVCDYLTKIGYSIQIKDHPRKITRLNFYYPGAQVIPPHVPADLCCFSPTVVIGICSSALAAYGSRSLSLIKLLSMREENVQSRISHLTSLPGGGDVTFARDWVEFLEKIHHP